MASAVVAPSVAVRPVRQTVLAQGVLAFAGSVVLNIGGFGFHAIAGHRLGVHAYGMLYAVISIAALAALPVVLVAPSLARLTAEYLSRDAAHASRLARDIGALVTFLTGIYACAFAVLSPLAAVSLRLPIWSLWLAGAIAASIAASALFRALVQGGHRFGAYALSAAGEGIAKFSGIVVLTTVGMGLAGGVIGFLAGAACGAVIAAFSLRPSQDANMCGVKYDVARIAVSGGGAAAMTIALTLMGSADVVLVKHFFAPQEAGLYAAASLVGKMVLYAVGFIPLVLLPIATTRHTRGEPADRALGVALVAFAALAAATLLVISVGRFELLHLLVGRAFDDAAGLLTWYAGAMAFLALAYIIATYGIATHRIAFAVPFVAGTVATLTAIAVSHSTLLEVVHIMMFGNGIIAAAVILAVGVQSMREAATRA